MHPLNLEADKDRVVQIVYTNHRGELRRYNIIPHAIRFTKTEHYPDVQWLMDATDVTRNVPRTFAMKNVHSWEIPK